MYWMLIKIQYSNKDVTVLYSWERVQNYIQSKKKLPLLDNTFRDSLEGEKNEQVVKINLKKKEFSIIKDAAELTHNEWKSSVPLGSRSFRPETLVSSGCQRDAHHALTDEDVIKLHPSSSHK